jgi:hypothetical protein
MFHAIVFRPEGESCIDELTSSLLALRWGNRPAILWIAEDFGLSLLKTPKAKEILEFLRHSEF